MGGGSQLNNQSNFVDNNWNYRGDIALEV